MQLVIKDGKVFATHRDDQDIAGKYPGMTVVYVESWAGNFGDDAPTSDGIANLKARDTLGYDMRVIEDLVDAVVALGGTLPQAVLDRVNARKSLRS